jgi:diguanylate cyclase (GGDEF)-like protein
MRVAQPSPVGRAGRLRRRLATIRAKLWLGFAVINAMAIVVGLFAVRGIDTAGGQVVATFDGALMSISYARAAAADFAVMETIQARLPDAATADAVAGMEARLHERADSLRDNLAIASQRADSARARRAAGAVDAAVEAWMTARDGRDWRRLEPLSAAAHEQFDLLVNFTAGDGFLHRQRALRTVESARDLNLAAMAAAFMFSGFVTVVLARRLIGPVAAASHAANRIAAGELDMPIPEAGQDELGTLLAAMAVMRDNIRATVEGEIAERRSAQGRLVDALEGSREGVVLVDGQGRIANANSATCAFFGPAARLPAPGADFTAFAAAAGLPKLPANEAAIEAPLPDGTWLRIARSPTREGGFVAIFSDISMLKRTSMRFDAALSNMSQGLVLFDADNRLSVVNRRFAEIFGLAAGALLPGTHLRDLARALAGGGAMGGQDAAAVLATFEDLATGLGPAARTLELAHQRILSVNHQPMDDNGWVATFEDITERRQAEARIAYLARHDALTGLPNRVTFLERLEAAITQVGRGVGCAVLMLDLDDFRALNESRGNAVGDAVLRAAAERLSALVRETDTLARLGADEFAIVLVGIDRPEDAAVMARRIVEQLGQPLALAGGALSLGISCGIAVAPADGSAAAVLLRNADTALARAKQDGRGGFRFFEAELDARVQQRRQLEAELRQALAEQQFELHYQPLVELATGRVASFDALIRWRRPQRGMVSPGVFIPVAEAMGLIVAIGEWAIESAARTACTWPAGIKVAVNVSPLQFASPRLVEVVAEVLAATGLDPGRLELEITESTLLADSDQVMAILHRLKTIGVRIAMDDFGTGYSSLGYLRSFPFDKIKVDQSFVRGMADDAGAAAIVRAIIGLGSDLGMRITAAGVETRAQLAALRQLPCTDVQGHLFSKPIPAADLPALITRIEALPMAV